MHKLICFIQPSCFDIPQADNFIFHISMEKQIQFVIERCKNIVQKA
jgi:hypothetical protein